jgi:cell division protein FtsB
MPAAAPPHAPPHARPGRSRRHGPLARGALAGTPRAPLEGRIRWDRVARVALLALLAVVLALYVAPLRHWVSQSRAAAVQRAEVHQLERERDRLAARARDLERPETVEREARRLSMARRGERPYVVELTRGRP